MNRYDSLVGQSFRCNGELHVIVKCEGATVLTEVRHGGRRDRVLVSIAQVLDALEVTEINVTELPRSREDATV